MITPKNYFSKLSSLNVRRFPKDLREKYDYVQEITENHSTWEYYDSDESIAATVDEYFMDLSNYLKDAKSAKGKRTEKVGRVSANSQRRASIRIDTSEAEGVSQLKEEVKVVRKFVRLHNKKVSPRAILTLLKSLQRSVLQKLIRRTSPFANEIRTIQDKLIGLYKASKGRQLFVQINNDLLGSCVAIAGGERVYDSIGILKSYVGLQGKEISRQNIDSLTKRITAFKNRVSSKKEDPYFEKVTQLLKSLKAISIGHVLKLGRVELSGLEGLLGSCCNGGDLGRIYDVRPRKTKERKKVRACEKGTYSDSKGRGTCSHNWGLGEVLSASEMATRQTNSLPFTEPWLSLIGRPSLNFSIMFHGDPGSGKTTLLLKFAEYLALNFGPVMYVSSEEHEADLMSQRVAALLNPIPDHLDFAPNLDAFDLDQYGFVILDSVNDLGLKLPKFKELRKQHPNVAFILVLQHTKEGDYRGGKDWEHDIQIAARVENGVTRVYRNRYGTKGELNFYQYFNTKPLQQEATTHTEF